MPALAATPTDRGECAASADKPDVGFAACSRIIDDANVPVAERVNAFKNWGRGPFNGKDCDRAIADYGAGLPDVTLETCRRTLRMSADRGAQLSVRTTRLTLSDISDLQSSPAATSSKCPDQAATIAAF
jgi:hypothetical protein